MRKRFVTFVEGAVNAEQVVSHEKQIINAEQVTFGGVTNAEQVVTHEQLIISYARATTLLGKVTDQLLMSNNLLSICNKSVLQEESSLLVLFSVAQE